MKLYRSDGYGKLSIIERDDDLDYIRNHLCSEHSKRYGNGYADIRETLLSAAEEIEALRASLTKSNLPWWKKLLWMLTDASR